MLPNLRFVLGMFLVLLALSIHAARADRKNAEEVALSPATSMGVSVERKKGASGESYRLFLLNDLDFGWRVKRPQKSERQVVLCIPAAFTSKSGTVVGINAVKGKINNRSAISKSIGGAILIKNGDFTIFPTAGGSVFSKSFLSKIERDKSSMFQQFQIVHNGKPAKFKDKKQYQMRAIVILNDGRKGIVESKGDLSFKQFNDDLVGMGVADALYTDMGTWDEGWYRDAKTGSLHVLGNDRSNTDRQTNWVVFTRQ